MVKHKENPSPIDKDQNGTLRDLILFNDDVNTFDFVIQSLVEVCDHEPEQAEQCAMIAHFKGKCGVKAGAFSEIKPLCNEMTMRGLTVTVE
jgi:ATP-dependent Clp protease adaptor protein ClpS